MNCSGTGDSSALSAWITCWSRSFSRLETRIRSPWIRGCTLGEHLLDLLHQAARELVIDPLLQGQLLADRALRRGLDRPGLEDLERELSLDELALEHVDHRLELEIARPLQRDLVLPQVDAGARVLEVVARRDLPLGLVHRVDQLLAVELGDHIERIILSHGSYATPPL